LGYSASSASTFTSIRYTGRETSDPLGTLQTEKIEYTSGGAQVNLSRWGDYSAMRIDPSDDCTFWFTTEYIPSTGSFNWRTRILSFKFNSCGGAVTPDFSISATPASQTVTAGNGASYTVNTTALNSFSGNIALTVTGLPAGAVAAFNPATVAAGVSSALSITTTAATPAGSYPLTISATSGSLTHTATVTLVVQADAGSFTLSASPQTLTVSKNSTGTYAISVNPQGSFSGTVSFSVSGVPQRTSATFSPTSSPTGTTLSVRPNRNARTGTSVLTITGSSAGQPNQTVQVTLVIQ
jgi:uncharacterized membrane protein